MRTILGHCDERFSAAFQIYHYALLGDHCEDTAIVVTADLTRGADLVRLKKPKSTAYHEDVKMVLGWIHFNEPEIRSERPYRQQGSLLSSYLRRPTSIAAFKSVR